jgi:hypothetical protein
MTQQQRFLAALRRLQDFHTDSVKSQSFITATSSSNRGARILYSQQYPDTRAWFDKWRDASSDDHRARLVNEIEAELYTLGVGASQRYTAHYGTAEWKHGIATTEGSTRHVARLWGVSHTTVRRFRKDPPS